MMLMKKIIYILITLLTMICFSSCEQTNRDNFELIKPVSLVITNDSMMHAVNGTFLHIKKQTVDKDDSFITYWFDTNDYECEEYLENLLGTKIKDTFENAQLKKVKNMGYILYDDEMQYFHTYYIDSEKIIDEVNINGPNKVYVIHFDWYER